MTGAVSDDIHIDPELLLQAYASGIFPMSDDAEDPEIYWVRPEYRGVLPLDGLHIPRSLEKTIRRNKFEIRFDTDFSGVLAGCAGGDNYRPTTWINTPIRHACSKLHEMGFAHSVEAWFEGKLVGGLYGVALGGAFFGESMFSHMTDASKVCLVSLVNHLKRQGFVLLDTQFTTEHLERFGVIEVSAERYEMLLREALTVAAQF